MLLLASSVRELLKYACTKDGEENTKLSAGGCSQPITQKDNCHLWLSINIHCIAKPCTAPGNDNEAIWPSADIFRKCQIRPDHLYGLYHNESLSFIGRARVLQGLEEWKKNDNIEYNEGSSVALAASVTSSTELQVPLTLESWVFMLYLFGWLVWYDVIHVLVPFTNPNIFPDLSCHFHFFFFPQVDSDGASHYQRLREEWKADRSPHSVFDLQITEPSDRRSPVSTSFSPP